MKRTILKDCQGGQKLRSKNSRKTERQLDARCNRKISTHKVLKLLGSSSRFCIQLLACYTTEFKIYMIMPIAEYDLNAFIMNNGRVEEKKLQSITAQIIEGVGGLRKHNIVHCDLKPENILMIDHKIRISDFGLASILQRDLEEKLIKVTKRFYTKLYAKHPFWDCFYNCSSPFTKQRLLGKQISLSKAHFYGKKYNIRHFNLKTITSF